MALLVVAAAAILLMRCVECKGREEAHPGVAGGSTSNGTRSNGRSNELLEFEDALIDYISDWFNRNSKDLIESALINRRSRQTGDGAPPAGNVTLSEFDRTVIRRVARFLGTATDALRSRSLTESPETGRLFFFKGASARLIL